MFSPQGSRTRSCSGLTRTAWPWFMLSVILLLYNTLTFYRPVPILHQSEPPPPQETCPEPPKPRPVALDAFQDVHRHDTVVRVPPSENGSENAIVTGLYTDSYAIAISALGQGINRVNTTARRIVFYLPGRVSEQALCIATATGFEPRAIERVVPPDDGKEVNHHFLDQFTKLRIWGFDSIGIKALVYLDADTMVLRNFDELFSLPFAIGAVPDVYWDVFTTNFNAGMLFVRPNADTLDAMLHAIHTLRNYPRNEAEQAFLNAYLGPQTVRLPYMYNGNLAIKARNTQMWAALRREMAIIHYTLRKPFRNWNYDTIGMDGVEESVLFQAEMEDGLFREEMMHWLEVWREAQAQFADKFAECKSKSTVVERPHW